MNDGGQRVDSSRFWNTVRSLDDRERTRERWDLGTMRTVDNKPGSYHYVLGGRDTRLQFQKVEAFHPRTALQT